MTLQERVERALHDAEIEKAGDQANGYCLKPSHDSVVIVTWQFAGSSTGSVGRAGMKRCKAALDVVGFDLFTSEDGHTIIVRG